MNSFVRSVVVFAAIAATSVAYAASGADVYGDFCASCHGADGKAHTPAGKKVGAKDLTQSTLPDAAIIAQITNGKKNERGVEKMPAFKDRLSAADISAVAAYVKTLRKG